MIVGGGAGTWAYQQTRERDVRIAALVEEAGRALDRAETASGPEAASARQDARVALSTADGLAAGRFGNGSPRRLREARGRLAEADRLQRLVDDLESVRSEFADLSGLERADRSYLAAFGDYGWSPDAPGADPSTLVPRVKGRPSAGDVAAALDHWIYVRRRLAKAPNNPAWGRLLAVAKAIDPDPWRDGLRALYGRPEAEIRQGLLRLADDAPALARQPALSLVLLTASLRFVGERERARRVIRLARSRFPGDFWVAFAAGIDPTTDEETIRSLTAALALRPGARSSTTRSGWP